MAGALLSPRAALSLGPGALGVIVLQTPLGPAWVALDVCTATGENGLPSTAVPRSREIRNKPKPIWKRGLHLCTSRKELGSLGRLSPWLIATGRIFNYLMGARSSAEGSLQKASSFPPKSVFSLFKKGRNRSAVVSAKVRSSICISEPGKGECTRATSLMETITHSNKAGRGWSLPCSDTIIAARVSDY